LILFLSPRSFIIKHGRIIIEKLPGKFGLIFALFFSVLRLGDIKTPTFFLNPLDDPIVGY